MDQLRSDCQDVLKVRSEILKWNLRKILGNFSANDGFKSPRQLLAEAAQHGWRRAQDEIIELLFLETL